MLLVGTGHGVQDLETGDTFVEGEPVTALASSRAACCALLDRRHVVRLGPGGAVAVGSLPEPDGQSVAVLADGTVVLGRTGARLAVIPPDGEVLDVPAFGTVPGRDDWENPANPTPDTRTMAAGPQRWWVNVHVGGVWWSDDTGRTWHGAVEPDADVHEVRTGADGSVAVAAAVGFGWSSDDGGSWSWTTDGLHASYLRAAALDGQTAFVSASDGPFTKNGAVYRATLGSSFVRCEAGLPSRFDGNVDSSNLDAADGRAAIGFRDRVYLSEDAGVTWRVAAALPGPVRAVRFGPA
jgi:hypothetical protein